MLATPIGFLHILALISVSTASSMTVVWLHRHHKYARTALSKNICVFKQVLADRPREALPLPGAFTETIQSTNNAFFSEQPTVSSTIGRVFSSYSEPVAVDKCASIAISVGQLLDFHEFFSHYIRDRMMYYV